MQLLNNRIGSDYKITLPTKSGFEFIQVNEIIRCEARNNFCQIYLQSGQSYLAKSTLKHLQSVLSSFDFVRVHNAHLINIHHIRRYYRSEGGWVELIDGTRLAVARARKKTLISAMQ